MTDTSVAECTYHVLLIGIDAYEGPIGQLHGCVNDSNAMEHLLGEISGRGLIEGELSITRLLAPHRPRAVDLPDRDAIVGELRRLAGPQVGPDDKVLIFYAGHGYQGRHPGGRVQYEALVTRDRKLIYDIELNALISRIALRTRDLTILLDCCHSESTFRHLQAGPPPTDFRNRVAYARDDSGSRQAWNSLSFPPPDPAIVNVATAAAGSRPGSHLLESDDPDYIVLTACRAEEAAAERRIGRGLCHGVFTHSLTSVLGQLAERGETSLNDLRWADVWGPLVDEMNKTARGLGAVQHPFMIGRPERKVFGGKWHRRDAGFRVQENDDGVTYRMAAGTLMGVTPQAVLAVYGEEPSFFPALGSAQDDRSRWATLEVASAARATSIARPTGSPPSGPMPLGARGRMVRAGAAERLRVRLSVSNLRVEAELRESGLLELLPPNETDWDVEVVPRPGGGWLLNDTMTAGLATVMTGQVRDLRAGLEAGYRYTVPLRLAQHCADPQLNGSFEASLLSVSDQQALAQIDPADPQLDEVASLNGTYVFNWGDGFCLKLRNTSAGHALHFSVLNCTGSGKVEYLGDESANAGYSKTIWQGSQIAARQPFLATTGNTDPTRDQIDRLIVVATTRGDVSLAHLAMENTIQQTIDRADSREAVGAVGMPVEAWSARLIPWRIRGMESGRPVRPEAEETI